MIPRYSTFVQSKRLPRAPNKVLVQKGEEEEEEVRKLGGEKQKVQEGGSKKGGHVAVTPGLNL